MEDYFEKEEVYKSKVEPLLKEVKKICMTEKLPLYVSILVENQEKGATYVDEYISAESLGLKISDHRHADYIRVNAKIPNTLEDAEDVIFFG